MKDLFSKCGCNCSRCAAYKENVKTDEARRRGSEGLKKYLGFRIKPDRMYCDGCQTPDDQLRSSFERYIRSCAMRKCAIKTGVETCAHCSEYNACYKDLDILSPDLNREELAARLGAPIPEEDYVAFIEPFERRKHLDEIRTSLGPEDIVEVAKVPAVKARIVDFPDNLPVSKEERSAFEALHRTLAIMKRTLSKGDTYAQQAVLKKRRQWILELLWAFGLFGELKEEGSSQLVIHSETFSAQKINANLQTVVKYFKILEKYGVHCEHVPMTKEKYGKKGWLTPMWWLRKKGWFMNTSFDDNASDVSALKALKSYAAKLNEKYGKRAFRYFSNVDMRVLSKE